MFKPSKSGFREMARNAKAVPFGSGWAVECVTLPAGWDMWEVVTHDCVFSCMGDAMELAAEVNRVRSINAEHWNVNPGRLTYTPCRKPSGKYTPAL